MRFESSFEGLILPLLCFFDVRDQCVTVVIFISKQIKLTYFFPKSHPFISFERQNERSFSL